VENGETKVAESLGQLLRRLRDGEKLTQQALADELVIARSTYANWERDGEAPGVEALESICNRFPGHRAEILRLSGRPGVPDGGPASTVSGPERGRIWLLAAPVLALLAIAALVLVVSGGPGEEVVGVPDCTTPHPLVGDSGFTAEFTHPTEPVPKLSMQDGLVAGTFSGEPQAEQFWLLVYALDVARYWVSEQPMALDYTARTWRSIGGSIHIGNDDPGQVGRRFELVVALVEPEAIAEIPSSLEMGGWAVEQVPDGITMLACGSVFRG
jgi:DNA-binding XRE family transcriptional regulator